MQIAAVILLQVFLNVELIVRLVDIAVMERVNWLHLERIEQTKNVSPLNQGLGGKSFFLLLLDLFTFHLGVIKPCGEQLVV